MILSDEKAEELSSKSTAYALGILHGALFMFIGLTISWVITAFFLIEKLK